MKVVERDDLVRRLSGVLEIAATTVRVLLSESSEPPTSAEEPRPEKVLSETALLLLFIGIHNAWDTVTFIATVMRHAPNDEPKTPAEGSARGEPAQAAPVEAGSARS